MSERRSLIEGIKPLAPPVDPIREREFVSGKDATARAGQAAAVSAVPTVARTPISTKMRTDYAAALKRASLERQLKGVEPNTLQDILEQAIEPWLKSNGYLI
jgi:hypothetical protein